jgi:hypothetical protein
MHTMVCDINQTTQICNKMKPVFKWAGAFQACTKRGSDKSQAVNPVARDGIFRLLYPASHSSLVNIFRSERFPGNHLCLSNQNLYRQVTQFPDHIEHVDIVSTYYLNLCLYIPRVKNVSEVPLPPHEFTHPPRSLNWLGRITIYCFMLPFSGITFPRKIENITEVVPPLTGMDTRQFQ